jgi:hypothetical protein
MFCCESYNVCYVNYTRWIDQSPPLIPNQPRNVAGDEPTSPNELYVPYHRSLPKSGLRSSVCPRTTAGRETDVSDRLSASCGFPG